MRNETLDNSKVVAFRVMCSPLILSFMAVFACAAVAEGADSLGSTNGEATARRRPGALRQIAAGRLPKLDRTRSTTPGRQAGTRLLRVVGRFVYVPTFAGNELSGVDTILVEVRDDDTIGHSVLWSGYTDSNGYFDTGVVDISDDDNEPDLYVYFETNSPFVSVEDGDIISDNYSWDSLDSLLVDNFTGEFYDFGTHAPAVTGVGSSIPALDIFQVLNRAHRFLLQVTNTNFSKVNVVWPTGDLGEYDYDGEITLGADLINTTHALHQYAHHLERGVGMAVPANSSGCSNDCQFCERSQGRCSESYPHNECMFCPMTPDVARSEAFAEWFSHAVDRYLNAQYQFDSGQPFNIVSPGSIEYFPPETVPPPEGSHITDLSEMRALCGDDVLVNADRVVRAIAAFFEDLADDVVDDHAGDGLHECAFLTDGTVLTTYLIDKPADVLALIDQLILDFPAYLPALYSTALNMAPVYTARFPTDIDPPGTVRAVRSTSHPIGEGGPLPCITLEWQLPPDDVTGACAYSYEWTTDPAGLEPDMVEDVAATCTLTDGPFDLGQYYISMRAKDCAGHWSTEWDNFGPFEVIDCNDNGIVDICEGDCTPSSEDAGGCSVGSFCSTQPSCDQGTDCNGNGVPDDCDVASGDSEDCNEDEIPDECQVISHWAGGSGLWHDDINWEEGTVPGDVNVCIDDPQADVTVTYSMGVASVSRVACYESLVISGASAPWIDLTFRLPSFVRGDLTFGGHSNTDLHLESFLIVDGLLTLGGGTIDNGAAEGLVQIVANGGLQVNNTTNINGIFLDQDNASASVATDWISLDGNSIFKLRPGSTYDYQGNGTVFLGNSGRFENDGIFLRSAGTGDAWLDVFTQTVGVIHVMTGTLVLARGSISSGQFIGDPGTHLELRGGGHEFLPGSSIVADIVDFRGGISGSNTISGTYNVTTATTQDNGEAVTFTSAATIISYGRYLQIPRGTLNFEAIVGAPIIFDSISIGSTNHAGTANFASGDPVITDTLTLGPGLLTGPSEITVNGLLTWNAAGGFEGPGVINANGGLVIGSGAGEKNLWHRVMNNAGYCTVLGPFVMNYDDSMFNNLAGAVLDIQMDPGGDVINYGTLNNAGTLVKTAGAGTTTIGSYVRNTGTVEVKTGVLEFYTFGGLDYVQSAGQTILNGGDLSMFGPAPLAINGGVLTGQGTITGNVNVDGGTVAPGLAAGTLFINGDYTQSACSSLEIEIEGDAPGDFDVLEISGNAAIAGTLHIIELGESAPAVGDRLTILTASAVSGQFESVVGSANYVVQYNAQDVTLIRVALGDLDGDGNIDLLDASKLFLCFGGSGTPPATTCPAGVNADLDSDGDVDWDDWAIFAAQY